MTGQYAAKLDEKNRLIVPSKLREELGECFYVTLGVNCGHRCLTAYTVADWQTLTENYNKLPLAKRGAATSLIFMKAAECNPDKQYRFMLTQNLLTYAAIERDVVIVGRAGQAEIWDAEEFAAFELENLAPDKLLESFESIGL